MAQSYPDNGQLILTGQGSAGILVRPVSDIDTLLDLDLDGNDLFEFSAYLSWSEVEAEQDLTDTDGDGMYDSWEQANGLDPNAVDAMLDKDGDFFINIDEHIGGSDPDDIGSTPASAELSIATAVIGATTVGNPVDYELTVTNPGPSTASNVLVTNTLAAGVVFSDASGLGWNCYAENGIVYCSRDFLATGVPSLITIMVTLPPTAGNISNTATVSSVTLDTNLADNVDTKLTNVM